MEPSAEVKRLPSELRCATCSAKLEVEEAGKATRFWCPACETYRRGRGIAPAVAPSSTLPRR